MTGPAVELRSSRVTLRPFEVEQITERYVSWLNDPVVNEFSQRRDQGPFDASSARAYLAALRPDEMVFGIHLNDRGHVGNIKLGPIDAKNGRADISILIGDRTVWGLGIGREAVWLATHHLFHHRQLNRVDAGSCNPAFIHLALGLGWQIEGVMREYVRLNGQFVDHTILSQLAREFDGQRFHAEYGP